MYIQKKIGASVVYWFMCTTSAKKIPSPVCADSIQNRWGSVKTSMESEHHLQRLNNERPSFSSQHPSIVRSI